MVVFFDNLHYYKKLILNYFRNVMMNKIILLLVFFSLSTLLFAQDNRENPTLDNSKKLSEIDQVLTKKCSDFFEQIISTKVNDAYKSILSNSPINKNEDQIKNLIEQTNKANEMYGKMKSYQLVSAEKATPSLIRIKYLSLHSEYPMRWIFTFYKSPTLNWIIINIKFDDLAENFFVD
jgi:hypothetical protein